MTRIQTVCHFQEYSKFHHIFFGHIIRKSTLFEENARNKSTRKITNGFAGQCQNMDRAVIGGSIGSIEGNRRP